MRKALAVLVGLSLAITLGGCSSAGGETPSTDGSGNVIPTPDPSLIIPAVPAGLFEADPTTFDGGFGEFTFKVGDGPTWCTISPNQDAPEQSFAICEHNEASASYPTIPIPDSCDYSYGYQVRLWANKPAEGDIAEFPCMGGSYADASSATVLESGQKLAVAPFICYVDNVTARCENENGNYIVLGPEVWALGN
jgi:hypothetical protein